MALAFAPIVAPRTAGALSAAAGQPPAGYKGQACIRVGTDSTHSPSGAERPAWRATAALVAIAAVAGSGRRHPRKTARRVVAEQDLAKLQTQIVDEDALLAESSFPIKPEALITRCKEVLANGVGTRDGGAADFADDFEFCAPVVGPIGKKEYVQALSSFKIEEAFPDSNPQYHFFRVDPFEPDRVWFHTRKKGTNTKPFLGKPATGKALTFPPEAQSMKFNEQGLVKEFTVGYVLDRRVGNTGGLGGAFGYFYGVGRPLPIPECRPYQRSWQFRMLGFMSRLGRRFQKANKEDA